MADRARYEKRGGGLLRTTIQNPSEPLNNLKCGISDQRGRPAQFQPLRSNQPRGNLVDITLYRAY